MASLLWFGQVRLFVLEGTLVAIHAHMCRDTVSIRLGDAKLVFSQRLVSIDSGGFKAWE